MPIGSKGVAMADARDIAEVAAMELIRRDQAPGKLPLETINIVGPDTLTGADAAAIWSEVLGRPIAYGGDDPSGFEANMGRLMPRNGWRMKCGSWPSATSVTAWSRERATASVW